MVTLTNVGTAYDTTDASKGLGIAKIDFTGATSIEFDVRAKKVGSGTQSWQLFNETDAAELAVIDDAGAAGEKYLSGTFAVNLIGSKRVRVRAKSTVGSDDPIFFGASVVVT